MQPQHLQRALQNLPQRVLVRTYQQLPLTQFDAQLTAFHPDTVQLLTNLADGCRLWHFRHLTTVESVIDFKRGTGGISYLRKILDTVLFPEIWPLRTAL